MGNHYPFMLLPLPYEYNALEPYIDEETVRLHHDKHLKAYIDNLNKFLEPYPQFHNWSLEKLIKNNHMLPQNIQIDVKNNAGGVYNHVFYFYQLGGKDGKPVGKLALAINKYFGTYENFKEQLKTTAVSQFGSGYGWLAINKCGKLVIEKTANQDTVLTKGLLPLMLIDVWEHAYYLKYQYRRAEYAENIFKVIDWNVVNQLYEYQHLKIN